MLSGSQTGAPRGPGLAVFPLQTLRALRKTDLTPQPMQASLVPHRRSGSHLSSQSTCSRRPFITASAGGSVADCDAAACHGL